MNAGRCQAIFTIGSFFTHIYASRPRVFILICKENCPAELRGSQFSENDAVFTEQCAGGFNGINA